MQCEVLQGNVLGVLPQDEDLAPRPDAFPLVVLLIFLVLVRMDQVLQLNPIFR